MPRLAQSHSTSRRTVEAGRAAIVRMTARLLNSGPALVAVAKREQ
jgi:hypothetical protein